MRRVAPRAGGLAALPGLEQIRAALLFILEARLELRRGLRKLTPRIVKLCLGLAATHTVFEPLTGTLATRVLSIGTTVDVGQVRECCRRTRTLEDPPKPAG